MSEQNKTILRRFYDELFNTGDLSVADEIVALSYLKTITSKEEFRCH